MISRFALAGLTLAVMTGPAAAVTQGEPGSVEAPGTEAASPRSSRMRVARLTKGPVEVLPPLRPSFDAAGSDGQLPVAPELAASPVDPAAGMSQSVGRGGAGPDILPPLRPALTADDTAPAAEAPPAVQAVGAETVSLVRVTPPARPAFRWDAEASLSPAPVAEAPPPAPSLFGGLFGARAPAPPAPVSVATGRPQLDGLIAHHARLNGVPEDLVHRIVVRESRYNPRAVGRGGAMGLMQIKTGTARALGYDGGPSGLLDAETNLTYAVKYLAGAYRVSGGSYDRAVMHYARGYYYEAKRQGLVQSVERGGRRARGRQEPETAPVETAAPATPAPTFTAFRPVDSR